MSQPHEGAERGTSYRTPRWVKVFRIIAIVLVLLLGIMLLTGGEHSPSRHLQPASVAEAGDAGGHTPPVAHGTQQP